jgi:metallo-beta-lactamase family protein
MKLRFWGAARTVTGSMHEVFFHGRRLLLDCGLYQGRRKEAFSRNSEFPFPAASVEAVLLSHAHIDHSGNLPNLVKSGFSGPIYATPPTIDLCEAMLADSAYLQEKDAEFLNKRRARRKAIGMDGDNGEIRPLYTAADAARTFPLFRAVAIGETRDLGGGLRYRMIDAGHMLGSASLLFEAEEEGGVVRFAFSGDVGRKGLPIIRDPELPPPPIDYLILESTYGDRLHQDLSPVKDKLEATINRTCARGGRIVVPAFAVGRTQQLVLLLTQLMREERIPSIPMFVDSPLAVNVTEIFRKHAGSYDAETLRILEDGNDPFGFHRLRYIRTAAESKALNDLRGPYLVISASGMCEAGRILHHLKNSVEDPRNTILITGFQAQNTLGRKLVDKLPEVPIFGEPYRLRAEVVKLNELSGHADQRELLEWMKPLAGSLRRVFLVHGEETQGAALARAIEERYGIPAAQPARGDEFELSPGVAP